MRMPRLKALDTSALPQYAWASGRGILVSQWFTNGTLGSSWLTGFTQLGGLMVAGQLAVYAFYCVLLLLIGVAFHRKVLAMPHKREVLYASTALLTLGDLAVVLVGLEALGPQWYVPAMLLIGLGMAVPMLGWSEYCCALGERGTCMATSLSFVSGSVLLAVIAAIGGVNPALAGAVQVALIPLSSVCLRRAWMHVDDPLTYMPSDARELPPFRLRPVLPYLAVVAVFGLVFGIVIGINNAQPVGNPIIGWVVGTAAMGVSAFMGAAFARSFNLGVLARMLLPVMLVCLYLFPFAMNRMPVLVSILGCAGYTFSLLFYQTAFAAIAETRKVPALPLVALAICVDSVGIIVGEYSCSLFGVLEGISSSAVYTITFTAVIVAILVGFLFLGDRSTASLWGLKPEPTEREKAEHRSLAVAARHGLTLRETEVLCLLATGLDPADIARELGISAATARTHARNIYAKLELHSQPDLIRYVLFDS